MAKDSYKLWQTFDADMTWAEPLGGAPKLYAAEDDEWSDSRIGEPALGTGFSLPEANADELLSEAMRTWRDVVQAQGFSVSVEDGFVRVWRTKYLAELIPAGVTLDMQAHQVARWVDETLAILAQHDPGLTAP